MTEPLTRGQWVRVRRDAGDEWVTAMVGLASKTNPASVVLLFNGAVRSGDGWILQVLPLTIDYAAETAIGLYGGDAYEIEVVERMVDSGW